LNSNNPVYLLNEELNLIKDDKIREFTRKGLLRSYKHFTTDPASRSHHHRFKGGLIVHIKKAVFCALQKIKMYNYDQHYSDLLISALLLHDITKHVKEKSKTREKYNVHPLTVRILLWDLAKLISKEDFNQIMSGIKTHMGIFFHHLEIPKTQFQIDVYECDYLASREEILIKGFERSE